MNSVDEILRALRGDEPVAETPNPTPRPLPVAVPPEERIMRLVIGALLVTQKDTPAATRRCRKHRLRALEALTGERAASAWLTRQCMACGKCPGITPRP